MNVCRLATLLGVPIVYVACAYEHLGSQALEAKLRDLVRGEYRPRVDLRMAIPGSDSPRSLRSASATPISRLSIALNDDPLTSLVPALWNHAIKLLVSGKAEATGADAPTSVERIPPPRWTLLSTLGLLGRHVVHRHRRTGNGESWEVGVRRRVNQEGAHRSGDGYNWLVAPPGCWYADPFVVEADGAVLIFVEEFVVDRGKGRIVCLRLNDSLAVEERIVALERPYHLAYPHIFTHEGAFFMIPESGANGTVEIYRAKRFPGEWEFVQVLYRGSVFDTTVARHNGSFWFFTSRISDQRGSAAELLLFQSDSLLGDWTPHPLSPLSLDASTARGGGSVFEHDGSLVRPVQDCSRVYGGGVTFHTIEELTRENFRATKTGALGMRGKVARMHTYNRSRSFEVIDRVRSD